MNREIKFRAYAGGVMVYFGLGDITRQYYGGRRGFQTSSHFSVNLSTPVSQYIGLKDKNGKEGYFDDLVRWGKSLHQIIWNELHGKAMLKQISGSEVWPQLEIVELGRGEIIGNIVENKELLDK